MTRKASVPTALGRGSEDVISVVVDEVQNNKERKRSLRSRKTKTKMVHCDEGEGEAEQPMVLPEKEEYQITLHKGDKGLGITVAGYICEKGERS